MIDLLNPYVVNMYLMNRIFFVNSAIQSQVKPTVEKLNSDADVDVKYFASEAIALIPGLQ